VSGNAACLSAEKNSLNPSFYENVNTSIHINMQSCKTKRTMTSVAA
jgi:hypothetical protein